IRSNAMTISRKKTLWRIRRSSAPVLRSQKNQAQEIASHSQSHPHSCSWRVHSDRIHAARCTLRTASRDVTYSVQGHRRGRDIATTSRRLHMQVMKVLGLAAVGALFALAAPAERAKALSLSNPGAAAAVQQDAKQATTEVHWRHHGYHRHHHWH